MNRNITTALVLAAAFAGNAFAESPLAGGQDAFVAQASRAQVQAELVVYRQAGVNPWSTQYNPLRQFKSNQSRDQVVGQYLSARNQVNAFTAEDSGSTWLAQAAVQNRVSDTLAGTPTNAH